MQSFGDIAFTPSVQRHQRRRGSLAAYQPEQGRAGPNGLGPDEVEFLSHRDSFYLASVGQAGWPYVQHRGGAAGFLRVVDPTHLAWAERFGNRQFVTAGNLDHDDRVSLIAVDYPARQRLKVLGHARWDPEPTAELLADLGITGRIEGVVTVEVKAFDWNCPKYITPRYTEDQVVAFTAHLSRRIADLEEQLAANGESHHPGEGRGPDVSTSAHHSSRPAASQHPDDLTATGPSGCEARADLRR